MLKKIVVRVVFSALAAFLASYAMQPFSFFYLFCYFSAALLTILVFREPEISVRNSILISLALGLSALLLLVVQMGFTDQVIGFAVFESAVIVFSMLLKLRKANENKSGQPH